MSPVPMQWYVAAPFLREASGEWLTAFVPNEDNGLKFKIIPADYSHDRSRKVSGWGAWRDYLRHAGRVVRAAREFDGPAGILTSFPQLPVAVGIRRRLASSKVPVVAWTFNLGRLYPGIRRHLSRAALSSIDRFVVHSRAEVAAYSDWLDLPPERFKFVPFETPTRTIEFAEDVEHPFVLSMGSAQRDYGLLFRVLAKLKYPAIVVAGAHAVAGLSVPPNVTVRSGLSAHQCFELMQQARFNVVPVANQTTASGQVTMLDAMMYGRAVVITSCPASVDYITDGTDGMLVRCGDETALQSAMQRMWEDSSLRASIGVAARRTAIETFSEDVVGGAMGRLLREVGAATAR